MNNQDIDDPFAQFDDLDNFDNDFDQVNEGGEFDSNAMGASGGDDFGGESLDADDDMGMPEESFDEPATNKPTPTPSNAPVVQAGSTPFLKTPLGMATVGLAVVGLIGGAGTVLMSGGSEPAIVPETAAVIPPSSEPNFAEATNTVPVDTVPQAQISVPAVEQAQPIVAQPIAAQPIAIAQPEPIPFEKAQDQGVSEELAEFMEEQRREMKALRSAMDSLNKEIHEIQGQLNSSTKAEQQVKASLDSINSKLAKAPAPVAATAAPAAANVQPVAQQTTTPAVAPKVEAKPVEQAQPLAQGRERVADFQVIDSTSNGQMVIIKKASSGRVFTVFKGEVLVIGGKRLTVQSIEGNGSVVLLGDKLFIDKTLAAKPVAQVRATQASAKPKATSRPASRQATARDAKGFTLNAVYDSDSSFGVVDNKGNFKSYRVGETVPELGGAKVQGLDANGNLRVGDYLIKSIY